MKRLLWVGDSPTCPSGFGRASKEILDSLCFTHDVTVLGINAIGDPHDLPYPIYLAAIGGDGFGVKRLIWMCDVAKPDIIIIQQDGWNIQSYVRQLRQFPDYASIPIVAALAVDGKNFQGKWLDGVTAAVFWTQFALNEARQGGYTGPASVIPLGVDLETFYPISQRDARKKRLPMELMDCFIVGNVNRNQPRKRWDLTIKYFAEWAKSRKYDDAYLYLHTAPTGDTSIDVKGLAEYYGIMDRLALMEPPMWYGISEDDMRETYNCFDVQVSTTQGEGFGLTTFEGMACGVPQILPDWSALGELCKDAAWLAPCSATCVGSPWVNVIGGVPDQNQFTEGLDRMYLEATTRKRYSESGLARVREDRFRWANIGDAWTTGLNELLVEVVA